MNPTGTVQHYQQKTTYPLFLVNLILAAPTTNLTPTGNKLRRTLMTIPSWSMVIMLAFYFSRKNVRLAMDPIIHEDYQKDFQYNNDIALLKLAEEVDNPFLNMFFFFKYNSL